MWSTSNTVGPRWDHATLSELRLHRVVNRSGLRLGTYCVRLSSLRPVTRVSRLHCPLGQLGQIGVSCPHVPAVRQAIAQSVKVMGERELDPPSTSAAFGAYSAACCESQQTGREADT